MKEDSRKKIIAKAVKGRRQNCAEVAREMGVSPTIVQRTARGESSTPEMAELFIKHLKITGKDAEGIRELAQERLEKSRQPLRTHPGFNRSESERQWRPFSHLKTLSEARKL